MSVPKDKKPKTPSVDLGNLGWTTAGAATRRVGYNYTVPGKPIITNKDSLQKASTGIASNIPITIANPSKPAIGNFSVAATGVNTDPNPIDNPNTLLGKGMILPSDQAKAQDYLANPTGFFDRAKATFSPQNFMTVTNKPRDWLASLFDSNDSEKEVFGEAQFDGILNGLNWTTDTVSSLTVAALSAVPGGTKTLTWDEAHKVSVAQEAFTNTVQGVQLGLNTIANLTGRNIVIDPTDMKNNILLDPNFDITDEVQRKKAFDDNLVNKLATGIPDAAFTIFADPLIIGGKIAKLSRIRWVDRPVATFEQNQAASVRIINDVANINSNTAVKSTEGLFLKAVSEVDSNGKKVMDQSAIYKHPVIKQSTTRDTVASLLYQARDANEAGLIMRVIYNDPAARTELLAMSPKAAVDLGAAQRALLDAKMWYNPSRVAKEQKNAEREVSKKEAVWVKAEQDLKAGNIDQATADLAWNDLDAAKTIKDHVDNFTSRSPTATPITPEEIKIASDSVQELIDRNQWLNKALTDQGLAEGAFAIKGGKGFAVDNAFGRAIERGRIRRSVTSARLEFDRTLNPWSSTAFYDVGIGGRIVNAWRWTGYERPSGYIQFKGVPAGDQGREVLAVLNDLKYLKGTGKEVEINGVKTIIGGVARKEQLFADFLKSTGTTVRSENEMAMAVDKLERALFHDIGAYHNMDAKIVEDLLKKAQSTRTQTVRNIRQNKGFFVDKVPSKSGKGFDEIIQKLPISEAQLSNGTYMFNFKEAEKLARRSDKVKTVWEKATLNNPAQIVWKTTQQTYDIFNDLWRPSVLLRLGYTQRNLTEGFLRACLYTSSLAPLGHAGEQAGLVVANSVKKRAFARDMKFIEEGAKATGTDVAKYAAANSSRFKKWVTAQDLELETQITNKTGFIDTATNDLKAMSAADPDYQRLMDHMDVLTAHRDDLKKMQDLLHNDVDYALTVYRRQGGAKRRLFDGTTTGVDGTTYSNAFRSDISNNYYGEIAWRNMSSENTTKAIQSIQDDVQSSIYRSVTIRTNVKVTPDMGDEYFKGVSEMLNQFRQSDIGLMIIKGESDSKIVRYLTTDPRGIEISHFLNGTVSKQRASGFSSKGIDGAQGYVQTMRKRLNDIAPNPKLVDALKNAGPDWRDVKRFLEDPLYKSSLKPAIGNIAEELAAPHILKAYTNLVSKAFRVLGTLPEDAFVRAPFYGKVYKEFMDTALKRLSAEYKDSRFIPTDRINIAERQAHRRALKETKSWLYTIDRRTNLGHYGEYLYPFISATQNAVTTVGKLTWRDPAVPFILQDIWNAPDNMGLVDEEGNIAVYLPEMLIPESLRTGGTGDLLLFKFSKGGFNVILPNTQFYSVLPRMGPIGVVVASQLMEHNFLGLSVDTPEWGINIFGKERADSIWGKARDYVYGENRGVAGDLFRSMLSPGEQKLYDLWRGTDSQQYSSYLEKVYNSKRIKASGGYIPWPENGDAGLREESIAETNAFMVVQAIGNYTTFTPPQYEFVGEPLVDTLNLYKTQYPNDYQKAFSENFGPILASANQTTLTKNVAGLDNSMDTIHNAKKFENIIREISPHIQNLNVLGLALNGSVNAEYDPSALSMEQKMNVPGLSTTYRPTLSPEESSIETSKSMGWTEYIKLMGKIDVELERLGVKSINSKGAEALKAKKEEFIQATQSNPLFAGWYEDYTNFGGSRSTDAVQVATAFLKDKEFIKSHTLPSGDLDPIWTGWFQYITKRQELLRAIEASGVGIGNKKNKDLKDSWDSFRAHLKSAYNGWDAIANRYLNGDDDPKTPSTINNTEIPVVELPSVSQNDPSIQVDANGYLITDSNYTDGGL